MLLVFSGGWRRETQALAAIGCQWSEAGGLESMEKHLKILKNYRDLALAATLEGLSSTGASHFMQPGGATEGLQEADSLFLKNP